MNLGICIYWFSIIHVVKFQIRYLIILKRLNFNFSNTFPNLVYSHISAANFFIWFEIVSVEKFESFANSTIDSRFIELITPYLVIKISG
jgi:hypothetical protein